MFDLRIYTNASAQQVAFVNKELVATAIPVAGGWCIERPGLTTLRYVHDSEMRLALIDAQLERMRELSGTEDTR